MARRFTIAFLLLVPALTAAAEATAIERFDAEVRSLVERAALEAAAERVAAPDRFEVLSYRFGGVDPAPLGTPRLEPLEVEGPNAAGFVRLRFRLLVDDVPRGEARATVRGTVRGPALVAARTLSRGEPIGAGAITVVESDLTRLTAEPLRDPAEAFGLAPGRTLGAGRVLTRDLVVAAPVVRRGEIVDLRIEHAGLRVSARGLARTDGAPGERIAVRNTASGAELIGVVLPDGSLRVVRGPLGGGAR